MLITYFLCPRETIVSQNFESGNAVHCFAYDPKGAYLGMFPHHDEKQRFSW